MLSLHTDVILQSELDKRDNEIKELKEKYSAETKLRIKTEKKQDNLAERLVRNLYVLLTTDDVIVDWMCRKIQRRN